MHSIQEKILKLADQENLLNLSLRDIALKVGEEHPQKIKHHFEQLKKKGLLKIKQKGQNKTIERVKEGLDTISDLINVPIYGAANCGPATIFADEHLEGFLKISPYILKKQRNIFALRAEGSSMNRARIAGENIEDGDYVIVSRDDIVPQNGEYVLTIIDGMANIKKYIDRSDKGMIVLVSESTENFPPIYLTEQDNFQINGTVLQVVKGEKSLAQF